MSTVCRTLARVSFLALATGLRAAEPTEFIEYVEVDEEAQPESNTVATKLPVPSLETPANVGVVTRPVLDEQNAFVLGDALHNISSLNVQAGPSIFDFFTIRGFDSITSSLILTDGASEPESTFLPMYNVEAIEVLKGPGGFLYGPNPLAGTVNVVRKQPVATDFTVVGAQAGSFDTYEGRLDWNVANEDGDRAFRLNALFQDSEGYRDRTESQLSGINPSFLWKPGENTTLTFNAEYQEAEFQPDSGTPLITRDAFGQPITPQLSDLPRRRSYQTPFDFSEQEVGRFQLDVEHRLSDTLHVRNKLYFRSLDWNSDGTLFNGTVPGFTGETLVLRTLTRLDDSQRILGNQLEAVLDAATGSVQHQVLAGLEVGQLTDEFALDILPPQGSNPGDPGYGLPAIDLFNPVELQVQAPTGLTPFQNGDVTSTVLAPYLVDQIDFSDQFHVTLGLRWDTLDFEDDDRGISRDDSELSPKLGLLWAPNPGLAFYGNGSRSWALPSPRLTVNQLNSFDPQESTQFEVGIKQRLAEDRVRLTVAAYQLEMENLPVALADGFTQQEADQESQGFELELATELAPRLRALFAYSYTDAELTRFARCDFQLPDGTCALPLTVLDGNRPAYAPEHLANLWLSKDFTNGWGIGGGGRYVGEQFFNEDNLFEVDDYFVLDAAVWRDWTAWRARLNFQNLTDEEYETGSFASTSIVPADPFAVYGTVEYRF